MCFFGFTLLLNSIYTTQKKKMIVCYYQVTYEFQNESALYSLSECQGTPSLK